MATSPRGSKKQLISFYRIAPATQQPAPKPLLQYLRSSVPKNMVEGAG